MELYAIHKVFIEPYLEAIENATIQEKTAAFDRFGDKPVPSIISRTEGSNEAVIAITGPLSPTGPSPIARFFGFGGTGYADIMSAAKTLEDDPAIENVRIRMDTPGGTVNGMDQARQAIESLALKKNVIVENHGMIASAGYYLATAEGVSKIVAMSPLAETGSIGIIRAGLDFSDALARNGIKRIKIISSNAPNKHADPTTAPGLKVHQVEIDAVERVFIDKAAKGRNTTTQDVIDNFGKGGMLIAQDPDPDKPDALKVGMIDEVVTQSPSSVTIDNNSNNDDIDNSKLIDNIGGDSDIPKSKTVDGGGKTKGAVMDLITLKAEHPAIFAEAVAVGVTQERERVDAHITMGEASGDMKLAVTCISEGTELNAAVNAKYMAASMNKNAKGDRASESEGDLDTEGDNDADAADKALAAATAEVLGVDIDA